MEGDIKPQDRRAQRPFAERSPAQTVTSEPNLGASRAQPAGDPYTAHLEAPKKDRTGAMVRNVVVAALLAGAVYGYMELRDSPGSLTPAEPVLAEQPLIQTAPGARPDSPSTTPPPIDEPAPRGAPPVREPTPPVAEPSTTIAPPPTEPPLTEPNDAPPTALPPVAPLGVPSGAAPGSPTP